MRGPALLVFVLGCGNVTSPPDGPPAPPPDMPNLGAHRHYVMDRQAIPTTSAEIAVNSLDLDGDGMTDNQLCQAFSTLASQGFDVASATKTAVDRGTVILLFDLQSADLATAATATFTTLHGFAPIPAPCVSASDVVCRQHLGGTGAFNAESPSTAPPLAGAISGGVLTGGPGKLTIEAAPLGAPVSLELIGARVKVSDITDTTIGGGVLGGAIPPRQQDGPLSEHA